MVSINGSGTLRMVQIDITVQYFLEKMNVREMKDLFITLIEYIGYKKAKELIEDLP